MSISCVHYGVKILSYAMTFISRNKIYTEKALVHFEAFISEHSLFNKDCELLVAISGGLDSIVLGYMLTQLKRFGYSNCLRFIYIDHNTRSGQEDELKFVESFANHLNVKFTSKVLKDLNPDKNFEHLAREKRYKALKDELRNGELLLLAHHIDDSFEWSILQGLRSSNLDSIIGIPVVNGKIRRPMMCFTKKQIRTYANHLDLPFIKDPTNELIKYERNFLRHKIINSFAIRHPKYLKHYVNRHNELARRLGMHQVLNAKTFFNIRHSNEFIEVYNFSSQVNLSGLDSLVLKAVKILNPKGRGVLNEQIKKIKQALNNNKHGPLTLSGGIKVYIDFNYLLICSKSFSGFNLIEEKVIDLTYPQFKTYLETHNIPKMVEVLSGSRGINFPRRSHPIEIDFMGRSSSSQSRYLSALNLLRQWSRPKNINKSLKLRFFIAS